MNLAIKDISYNIGRFVLTAVGIGMLLMVVMGMGGIYRGVVEDATLLIDRLDADLWVVQRSTRGPFAEISRVPAKLSDRALAVPGVRVAREFVYHTIQRQNGDRVLRMAVLGLSWPTDKGDWIPLVEGRPLGQSRFELIADQTLKLPLGKQIEIGNEVYQVVGISRGMISSAGDGIAFLSSADALAVQLDVPGEAVRLERAARESRGRLFDVGIQQPALLENATRQSGQLPAIARPSISAVLVTLEHPSDAKAVAEVIGGWTDVTVYTADEQRNLLLKGSVEKVRSQIGLFRILLTIIATIIMALILYTLTLDKLHSIALLKLIGASNSVLLGLILQQALILGASGFGIAYIVGQQIFPKFPRRVIITSEDLIQLAIIVFVISIASSALGVWKAMVVSPNEALA